jgi:hypothetical protein
MIAVDEQALTLMMVDLPYLAISFIKYLAVDKSPNYTLSLSCWCLFCAHLLVANNYNEHLANYCSIL